MDKINPYIGENVYLTSDTDCCPGIMKFQPSVLFKHFYSPDSSSILAMRTGQNEILLLIAGTCILDVFVRVAKLLIP